MCVHINFSKNHQRQHLAPGPGPGRVHAVRPQPPPWTASRSLRECGQTFSINVHSVSFGELASFFSSACQKLLIRACSCSRTSAGSCSSWSVGTGPDNSNKSTQWFHQAAPGWLSCLVQWAVREQLAAGAPLTSGCILPTAGTASARSAATPPSVGRIVAARTWPQEAQLPSPDLRQVLRADVAPPHAVGTSAI